ncbi:MAG: serine/threonine protein kinase [Labilithrix sp.]|nr:serine/threonine protein kinase [Labilithrix sp.]MCW5809706.1 serine/threonine protein kinase [Labilithrix sp.]
MPARGPQPGDLIGERFRLELMIGTGGMGAVWSAAVEGSDERAAVKFLHSQLASDPLLVQRFLLEARAGMEIEHPNVVRVIAQGFVEASEPHGDPAPWLAMELLDGRPLGDALRLRGRVEAVDALAILADVTAGIAAAHAKGIVHRDIKPGNVFLQQTEEGIVAKVLDFGISKYVDPAMDGGLTSTGAVVGSALYMSPEQAAGGYNVDPRTDVWSLGVMLYRMLTGEHPLPAGGQQEVMVALGSPKELDLSALRHPRIPPAAAEIVRRCLRKKREERVASAIELEPELRAALKLEIARARTPDIDDLLRPASSRATVIAAPPGAEREPATSATAPTGFVVDAIDTASPASLPPLTPASPGAERGPVTSATAPAGFAIDTASPLPAAPPAPRRPPASPAWVAKAGAIVVGIGIVVIAGSIYRLRAATPAAPEVPPPPASIVVTPAPSPPASASAEEDEIEELDTLVSAHSSTARPSARPARPRPRPKPSAAPSVDPWRRPGF